MIGSPEADEDSSLVYEPASRDPFEGVADRFASDERPFVPYHGNDRGARKRVAGVNGIDFGTFAGR